MRPLARSLSALLLLGLGACAGAERPATRGPDDAPVRHSLSSVPPALAPAVARAEAAMKALRERLAARLAAALASGGPAVAVETCRAEAAAIAGSIAAQTGVEVGRSGVRARGRAPAWAARLVEESAGRRAEEVAPIVLELGDRVVVVRPIAVGAPCLACHGGPDRVAPEVAAAIAASSADAVGGFSDGELAGFVWGAAAK